MTRAARPYDQDLHQLTPAGKESTDRKIVPPVIRRRIFTVALGVVIVSLLGAATEISAAVYDDRSAQQGSKLAQSDLTSAQGPQAADRNMHRKLSSSGTEQSEVKPLQITYEDGELTIVAENVPLSEVLSEVRKVMGADINIPTSAAGERIWVRFGPGPARNILRDLLDGTDLDYVIQGSDTDTDGVRSVSLTARGKTSEAGSSGNQIATNANRRAQTVSARPQEDSKPESRASETATASEPAAVSEPAPPLESPTATNAQLARAGASPVLTTAPLVGSAEQMAQQLQRLYQQRRQIQMQENQKPSAIN